MRNFAILSIISCAAASGQVTGSITGSVTDPSGAAVPKAKVSLMLAGGARVVAETETTAQGLFSIETIRPELYDLKIEAAGFVAYTLRNMKVDPSRATDLPPVRLEVAANRTSVDVTAGLETVQVGGPEISTTVTVDQIKNLPVADRGPLAFIQTQAGVGATQYETDIDGQRSSFSTVTLDGINIQDNYIRTGGLDYVPNKLFLDQVKEFTVNTSNMSSVESGASQVNFSTPSGTNQFHGDVLWQNRNNSTAANDFFDNSDGVHLPRLNLNQGGGSVGGPIKHDRLFFYTNYEFYRLSSQTAVDQTILTATARQGIFKYVTAAGQVQQLNLLNYVGLQPDPAMAANLAQVPGPDKINNFRVGDSQPGQLLNTGGYSFLVRDNVDEDNVTGRLDYYVAAKHSIQASYAWNREFVDRPDAGVGYGTIPPVSNDNARNFLSLAWRYSPSGSLTNEVRAGFNLAPATFSNSEKLPPYLIGGTIWSSPVATASANGLLPQGRNTRTYALQDNANWVHGRHTVSFGFQTQLVYVRTYDYSGTVPQYNVGITSSQQQNNLLFSTDLPGLNSSNDLNTANLLLASLAGLLDNAGVTYNVNSRTSGYVPGAPYLRHWNFNNYAFYGMDQWKLPKRVTLTAGVRWDYYAPPNERDSLELQPVLLNGDARTTLLNPNGTLNFVGNSVGRPYYNKDLTNFAPNVGLAWDVFGNGKSSMRAGYGIHYVNDENLTVAEAYTFTNPGLQGFNDQFDLSGFISKPPALPAPPYQVPLTFFQGYQQNPEVYYGMIDPGLRTPYVQEWNFSLQQEIKGNIIDARYVGNHATKLLRGFDYNQEDIVTNGFLADFLKAQSNGNLALAAGDGFSPAYNAKIPGSQPLPVFAKLFKGGLLTDPTYKTLIQQGQAGELGFQYQLAGENGSLNFFPNPNAFASTFVTNFSNSTYDALQLETRRRLKNGLSYQVNYTFSKWLSDAAGVDQVRYEPFLDINNPKIEKARTPTDLTHQFKANYIYELPMGPGHRFTKKGWDRALSGWKTSSNLFWISGNPFSMYSGYGTTLSQLDSGTNEAVTSLSKGQLDTLLQFRMTGGGPYMVAASAIGPDGRGAVANQGQAPFTGEAFFNPGAGQVGTLQKRMFTGPSVFNWDAAVIKETPLREHVALELRVEALNVFNHPTFAMFSQSIDQLQFGKVTNEATAPRRLQFGAKLRF
ncbi:MAG TPA: TonB-dependent receptor [Bryobacteraceae bacterium]|nr:TonB-dependent receptor [Bryobacteraceae bacterium]